MCTRPSASASISKEGVRYSEQGVEYHFSGSHAHAAAPGLRSGAREAKYCLHSRRQSRWGELGVYGGGILPGAPTSRIDKLAGEGLRLLNFNVDTECVPTRSSLMTGRHARAPSLAQVFEEFGRTGTDKS